MRLRGTTREKPGKIMDRHLSRYRIDEQVLRQRHPGFFQPLETQEKNRSGGTGVANMKMTLRWFGEEYDSVKLWKIRQIPGVVGVISGLYDAVPGAVWARSEIRRHKG